MQYKKRALKEQGKTLLQFEKMIAAMKNYIVGLEDNVIGITQKVE